MRPSAVGHANESRWAGWGMVLAGAAHTACFAPLGWWPLQWPLLALLAWGVLSSATVGRAAWLGWCFAWGWLTAGLWWLYISLHDFGGLHALLSGLAVVLLAAALALYLALAMGLVAWWRPRGVMAVGVFAAAWLLAELARAQWFSGFPWLVSGYVHTDGPLSGLAPWIGVYGLGAVAALMAAAAAQWVRQPGRPLLWLALCATPLVLGVGLERSGANQFTRSSGVLRVSLLQPNVPQDIKFDPAHVVRNMQKLAQQVQAARGSLVVTPESVLPLTKDELDPIFWAELSGPFRTQTGRGLLMGLFLNDPERGPINSLVGIHPGAQEDYAYGKRHLLPFGEYVPTGFHWLVQALRIPLGDQLPGRNEQAFEVAGQRVRPLICYEDLFGEDFARSAVGPQAAHVFANASNLAWFGQHMIQAQHSQFSRMRALEFQRPFVRSINTGATNVIDHLGRIQAELPAWTEGTLDAEVDGRTGDTPYARWLAHWGLWPLWIVAGLLLLAARWGQARPAGLPHRARP